MFDDCLVRDHNELCSAFNRHFAAAGHILEGEVCGSSPSNNNYPFINQDFVASLDHASRFTLVPVSLGVIVNAL